MTLALHHLRYQHSEQVGKNQNREKLLTPKFQIIIGLLLVMISTLAELYDCKKAKNSQWNNL